MVFYSREGRRSTGTDYSCCHVNVILFFAFVSVLSHAKLSKKCSDKPCDTLTLIVKSSRQVMDGSVVPKTKVIPVLTIYLHAVCP